MTNTKRASELLTGANKSVQPNRELADKLRAAYMAGYLERELDTREDDRTTIKIAERKAEQWIEQRGWRK